MITGRLLSNASLCAVMMWLLLGDVVEEGRRPNIVLIMADDMGYGDISSLNADSTIQTPVLDRLIDEGRNFTEAHTSASVCTPTRYALLTGRYSFRTGLRGVLTGYSKPLIEYDRETVASLLKKAGYSTAVIGKWHLGLEWQPKDPSRQIFTRDGFMPNDLNVDYEAPVHGVEEVGFDDSFIVPGSNNIAPFTFVENGKVLLNPTDHVQPQIEGHTYRTRRNGGDKAPAFELDETLKVITGKSVEYLQEKARTKSSPFFLYVPLTAPHFPWAPADEFRGESKAGLYGDYIEEIDHRVGEILQVIDDQELDDDTLVIFTADNGGAAEPWFVERYGHQMNKGRRGQKQQIWEGGVRVPFIARWKGVVEGGSETDEPISLVDMLATCAGLTGEPVEPGYGEDSYDMSSLLVGEGGQRWLEAP